MNIAEILHRASAAYANQPAVIQGQHSPISYLQLYKRVAAIAFYLRHQLNLATGERVAIAMDNRVEYIEVMFAAWHAGLVAVPINAKLHLSEFEFIIEDSQAAVCFTNNKLYRQFTDQASTLSSSATKIIDVTTNHYQQLTQGEQLDLEPREDSDLAWLFYTSGTTGRPKGAMQSHKNLYSLISGFLSHIKSVTCSDSIYHGAPMSHGSGYYILPFIAKGGTQLIPKSGGFDVPELIELLKHHSQVSFFAAPTMVKRLIEHPHLVPANFKGLDTIIYGGGPMYQTILQDAHQLLGHKLVQIYGQGECPMTISVLDHYQHKTLASAKDQQRLSSVGLPYLAMHIKVVDSAAQPCKAGESGEILVKGDAVMLGYWRNPAASEQSLKDGWLYTGDIGYLDNEGFLYLTDRSKDIIISGGSNIYPREVEEVLLKHPAVHEASVIGAKDNEWGEIVVAYIAAKPDTQLSSAELDAFCLRNMARFKRPKQFHFIDQLPKNSTGKILKTTLRKLAQ